MPGVKDLRKLQFGWEVTAGTAVAATKVWRGLGTLDDQREVVVPEENVGLIADQDRSYIPFLLAGIELEPVEATFEQLIFLGSMGIKTLTPASDGVGTGKIWDFAAHYSSTLNTIKTATIEGGDDNAAEEIEYCFLEKLKLEGKPKEAWKMSGTALGRQVSPSTFTGALSLTTVEDILFGGTKLYIDAVGGTIGTTLKSNTLMGFSLEYNTGIRPVFSGDGNLYFSFHKFVKPEVKLEVVFEHDAVATAQKVAWRAQTTQMFEIKAEGSNLQTGGTTYQKKTVKIDLVGKYTKFDKIDEIDGNDIVKAEIKGVYNSTAAKFFNLIVVNEVATL